MTETDTLKLFKMLSLMPEVKTASGSYNNYTDERRVHVELKDGREISCPLLPLNILRQHIKELY